MGLTNQDAFSRCWLQRLYINDQVAEKVGLSDSLCQSCKCQQYWAEKNQPVIGLQNNGAKVCVCGRGGGALDVTVTSQSLLGRSIKHQ